MDEASSYWVFGYGSLIWNPGFPHIRSTVALLRGAHRSLCVYSYRHRGTPELPGLVFGLMRGGSCRGMAFEVEGRLWPEVHAYLLEREMDRGVYREVTRPVRLQSGEVVQALAFVVEEKHVQFAGQLAIAEQVRLVRRSTGQSGPNGEYVLNTAERLLSLGIHDRALDALVAELRGDEMLLAESA